MDVSNNIQAPSPHRADDPPLPEAVQSAYFDAVLSASVEALSTTAHRDVDIELAGTRCRLRFAGGKVEQSFLPALQHLTLDADGEPDVTLIIWDSESSGVVMPPPLVSRECFSNRGDIWRMESPRFLAAFHWIESSVNLYDRERRVGVYWVPGTALLPFWAKASPFRTLFHWWIESTGGQLIHGACFGDDSGALLLTGAGGVGKSTTTLLALQAGLRYVGDDYLAVRLDPEPRAFSLYCTAKLDGPQMRRFPQLERLVANSGFRANEKAVVQLVPAYREQVVRSLPLKLLATPEFNGTATTDVKPATSLALQRAATFTTMSQLPRAGRYLHEFMHRLVSTLPGITLSLGAAPDGIVPVIQAQLSRSADALQAISASAPRTEFERLLTVIIPVYNGARFLREAVQCVLDQQYPAVELIVVDDGSTEDLTSIVRSLPVEVRLLRQENAGPAAARNRGIRDAGGEYLAFLDVDDLWPEGNLRHLVATLDADPTILVAHGRGHMVRSTDTGDELVGDPMQAFPYYIGAGVYRREAFVVNGLFNPTLRYGEDLDWFMRAEERGLPIRKLDEVSLLLRRHGSNMTFGKSMQELNSLKVMKLALDRRRAAAGRASAEP